MPNKKALLLAVIVSFAAAGVFLSQRGSAPPELAEPAIVVPKPVPGSRSKEQAIDLLLALPEIKAWSAQIESSSKGSAHGSLIEYDAAPKVIKGKRYWQLSFVENSKDAAHRLESFLVADQGDEVLVEDFANDTQVPLAQWRQERRALAADKESSSPDEK